jgi:hypothetical protein
LSLISAVLNGVLDGATWEDAPSQLNPSGLTRRIVACPLAALGDGLRGVPR